MKNIFSNLFNYKAFGQSRENCRAKAGDNVYIIVTHVKNEARQDFEKFMSEVFFDVLKNTKDELSQKANRFSRWLTPNRPNKDGTWTYMSIMDPVIEGMNYDIKAKFLEKYSEEETNEIMKKYESFMAKPFQFFSMIQGN